jgi:hypothetical protein
MTNDEIEDAFWNDDRENCIVREDASPAQQPVYDLGERTTRFGEAVIEARETKYFLRIVVRAVPELKPQARPLWQEAKELHLIFAKIWRSAE